MRPVVPGRCVRRGRRLDNPPCSLLYIGGTWVLLSVSNRSTRQSTTSGHSYVQGKWVDPSTQKYLFGSTQSAVVTKSILEDRFDNNLHQPQNSRGRFVSQMRIEICFGLMNVCRKVMHPVPRRQSDLTSRRDGRRSEAGPDSLACGKCSPLFEFSAPPKNADRTKRFRGHTFESHLSHCPSLSAVEPSRIRIGSSTLITRYPRPSGHNLGAMQMYVLLSSTRVVLVENKLFQACFIPICQHDVRVALQCNGTGCHSSRGLCAASPLDHGSP